MLRRNVSRGLLFCRLPGRGARRGPMFRSRGWWTESSGSCLGITRGGKRKMETRKKEDAPRKKRSKAAVQCRQWWRRDVSFSDDVYSTWQTERKQPKGLLASPVVWIGKWIARSACATRLTPTDSAVVQSTANNRHRAPAAQWGHGGARRAAVRDTSSWRFPHRPAESRSLWKSFQRRYHCTRTVLSTRVHPTIPTSSTRRQTYQHHY